MAKGEVQHRFSPVSVDEILFFVAIIDQKVPQGLNAGRGLIARFTALLNQELLVT